MYMKEPHPYSLFSSLCIHEYILRIYTVYKYKHLNALAIKVHKEVQLGELLQAGEFTIVRGYREIERDV